MPSKVKKGNAKERSEELPRTSGKQGRNECGRKSRTKMNKSRASCLGCWASEGLSGAKFVFEALQLRLFQALERTTGQKEWPGLDVGQGLPAAEKGRVFTKDFAFFSHQNDTK